MMVVEINVQELRTHRLATICRCLGTIWYLSQCFALAKNRRIHLP